METIESNLVHFTPGAIRQLLSLQKESKSGTNAILRIGVTGGGCAGLSYILEFDEKKEGDMDLSIEGIALVMNKAHSLYLSGITVDYQDGLSARGFTFQNPNAQTTCGCGSSFGI